MTYQVSTSTFDLAVPNDLVFIQHTQGTTQTLTVGNKVQLNTATTKYGTWSPTITSDVITLPSGYFYYIESSAQFYYESGGSHGSNMYTTQQHYDETNTQYVGVAGTCFSSQGEDLQLFSRDEKAKTFIDCTSTGIDISLKITANLTHNYVNYTSGHYLYSGLGRTIIWRLNS